MKSTKGVDLAEVTALYSGAQGEFMQILFGEQIHIGGMEASTDLAERAEIKPGSSGIDLCCCNGADMRCLVRFRGVALDDWGGRHGARSREGAVHLR